MRARLFAAGVGCMALGYGLAFAHLRADGTPMGLAVTLGALAATGAWLIAKAHTIPKRQDLSGWSMSDLHAGLTFGDIHPSNLPPGELRQQGYELYRTGVR